MRPTYPTTLITVVVDLLAAVAVLLTVGAALLSVVAVRPLNVTMLLRVAQKNTQHIRAASVGHLP